MTASHGPPAAAEGLSGSEAARCATFGSASLAGIILSEDGVAPRRAPILFV
jgi:hypothetical protein